MPDSWALITGASSGLGRALALELSRKGWSVILLARRREALERLVAELPGPALAAVLDLTAGESLPQQLENLLEEAGVQPEQIGLLINNAGTGYLGPFADESPAAIHQAIRVNIDAPAALIRWILPFMRQCGAGQICNIASVAAFTPGPFMASYYAAKAWMLSLGESLHEELRSQGISVTTCCPGPFTSEFHGVAGIDSGRLGRLPSAQRVATRVIRAVERKRVVAPIGFVPGVWAFLGVRIPRAWARRIVGGIQRRRLS